ncbi:MAG: hypothetical protein K8S25_18015 [Alphaproteobacteria bacterium]|nr:hypothetical protein [Alphaproteobacteria bacterium]
MLHKIGATSYVLWGVLHMLAASEAVRLALAVEAGDIQGRLLQNAWSLAIYALVATVIAVTMNWRNSSAGYWINLVTVSAADLGFIVFILVPGYLPLWPGALGPVLWIAGAIFSTLGLVTGTVQAKS